MTHPPLIAYAVTLAAAIAIYALYLTVAWLDRRQEQQRQLLADCRGIGFVPREEAEAEARMVARALVRRDGAEVGR